MRKFAAILAIVFAFSLFGSVSTAEAHLGKRKSIPVKAAQKRALVIAKRACRADGVCSYREFRHRYRHVVMRWWLRHRFKRASASWYGPGFYGNTMACGGQLTRGSMVVAHKTLPCGTKIVVCYRHRCVMATVRDRGPYVSGREFDLGPGVRHKLRFNGVAMIKWARARRVL